MSRTPSTADAGRFLHGYKRRFERDDVAGDDTGQGLATEAVRGIVEAGFQLGLAAVQLKASERNAASLRVAERAGFEREAILDDGRIDPGGIASRTVLFVRRKE